MVWLLALSLLAAQDVHAGKAHTHGVAQLKLSVEASQLHLALELPLDTLVGFERAPRTPAETEAARQALARLREATALVKPDAAAKCRLLGSEVQASVLEGQAKPAPWRPSASEHADALVSLTFECEQIAQLASVELVMFDSFRRLERVQAEMVTQSGQGKATVRRSDRTLKLPRQR